MHRIVIMVVCFMVVLGMSSISFSQNQTEILEPSAGDKTPAVNVGNKICPVSGMMVGGDQGMAPATYEYQGKIYNFCCSGCIEEFKKDPEKYIKKVEEELKANQGK